MECSKWGADILYQMLERHPMFEPLVVLIPAYTVHKGKDLTKKSLEYNFDFFKNKDIKVELAYNTIKQKYISLDKFEPDIVFYEQQYDLPPNTVWIRSLKVLCVCISHTDMKI